MTQKLLFNYSDARCGAGKTAWAINRMIDRQGRYIYAVDRREVYAERQQRMDDAATLANRNIRVITIKSPDKTDVRMFTPSVRLQIECLPETVHASEHVIVMITHEALKTADFSRFHGWDVIIDEVPSLIDEDFLHSRASHHHFKACYNLEKVDGQIWNRIVAIDGAIQMSDIADDVVMCHWSAFHRRVLSEQPVLTRLTRWEDMDEWSWWSLWSPLSLSAFNSRIMLANAFTTTIAYKIMSHHFADAIEFQPISICDKRDWQHRRVTIRYFATRHTASASFWQSDEGKLAVAGWIGWIGKNISPSNHFWTCNILRAKDCEEIGGIGIRPKVAGSNQYRGLTEASVIYSAKPSPEQRTLYRLYGVEPEDVVRAREYEDLIQVLFRSSIRVPEDRRDIIWNVYDQRQAEFLRYYLADNQFNVSVDLEFVDIGIDFDAPKRPQILAAMSEEDLEARRLRKLETDAERKRRKRAAQRAASEAAGHAPPKRGRPKKEPVPKVKKPRGRPRKQAK